MKLFIQTLGTSIIEQYGNALGDFDYLPQLRFDCYKLRTMFRFIFLAQLARRLLDSYPMKREFKFGLFLLIENSN
jgi:hypothetical protein